MIINSVAKIRDKESGNSRLLVVPFTEWENYQLGNVNEPSPFCQYVTEGTRYMSLDPDIAGAQSRPLRRNVVLRTLRSGQAESAKHEGKQV